MQSDTLGEVLRRGGSAYGRGLDSESRRCVSVRGVGSKLCIRGMPAVSIKASLYVAEECCVLAFLTISKRVHARVGTEIAYGVSGLCHALPSGHTLTGHTVSCAMSHFEGLGPGATAGILVQPLSR